MPSLMVRMVLSAIPSAAGKSATIVCLIQLVFHTLKLHRVSSPCEQLFISIHDKVISMSERSLGEGPEPRKGKKTCIIETVLLSSRKCKNTSLGGGGSKRERSDINSSVL